MRAGSAARAMTTLCGSNPRSKVTKGYEAAQEQRGGGQEHQVGARPDERRGGAEEKTGPDRQGGREGEHGSVDTDLVESGHASRNHRGRGAHDRGGHGEAQRTAGEAEGNALGQQLADNSAGPRAEGAADGEFAPARDPAREQQAGHVGAGHQQHQAGGRGQHQERRPERAAALFAQRGHAGLELESPAAAAAQLRHGRGSCAPRSRPARSTPRAAGVRCR